jgi:hypothetical protein
MTIYLYVKQHRVTKLKYFGKTTVSDPYKYNGSGLYWSKHLKIHGNDIDTIQVWSFNDTAQCQKFALQFSIENDILNSEEWANLKLENGLDGGFDGYRWYNNGIKSKLSLTCPGDGWVLGRIQNHSTGGYKWYNNGKINLSTNIPPIGDEWVPGMLPKNLDSIKNGTHHWQQPEHKEKMKIRNQKELENGTHSSQVQWVCENCNRSGKGSLNFTRWHGKNCVGIRPWHAKCD